MIAVVASEVTVRAGGATLLSDVACTARPGQLLAIVGPNGAGKSTLLSVLSGDRRPHAGRVRIGEVDVSAMSLDDLAVTRAVLAQDLPAAIPFSVADLVRLGRHPHRRDPANTNRSDRQAVAEAIGAVGLDGWEHRIVATLSGGERLRAHLARVIAQATPIVLLDEPTASLDVAHQEHVMRLCEAMASAGRAVVVVVHDLNAAARYADRIVVLDGGKVRADGPPRDVLRPDLLSAVYRQPIDVIDHPRRDCPLVLVVDR